MFQNNKLIVLLIAILVLANIATLGMYWWRSSSHHSGNKMPPTTNLQAGRPAEFLENAVGFDTAQKIKYKTLISQHQQALQPLVEKIKMEKDKFFNLIKNPNLTDSEAKKSVAEIGNLATEQDLITLQHFRQVRALCTPQQLSKFDSVIHQVLGMMAGQKPGPPPMGKDGRRPPPPDGEIPPPPDGEGPPPPKNNN